MLSKNQNTLLCGLRDKQNRLVVAKGEVGRGGKKQEFGISRGKLLYIEWVTNVAYSTGNYIRYPVKSQNGKEYVCVYIYICITESLRASLMAQTVKNLLAVQETQI